MADYSTRRGGLRAKLPLQVLRGFYPTEPSKLSSLAEPLNANDIKSGMVIVKDTNGKWIRAQVADSTLDESGGTTKSFYIALTDADALDVQASGKLVGLDCSDTFELQSGYFDKSVVWAVGDKLTVGANGTLAKAVADAALGVQVIGEVTEIGANVPGTEVGNPIPYAGFAPSCPAADAYLLQFKTVDKVILPNTIS
jgi:hypothetical protein